jgi:hypothetical protein
MGSDDPDYITLKKQQKDISDQLVGRALGSSASQGGKTPPPPPGFTPDKP